MSDEFLTTLDASASVYKKYQMAIHGDSPEECDRKSFFNFLVKSPLQVYFVYLISNDVKRHLCESAFLSRTAVLVFTSILPYIVCNVLSDKF